MSDPFFVTTAVAGVADNSTRQAWADQFGMLASIGCAIHCAAMPLVLAYLPSLGLGWLAGEGFHQWMAVVCFALAAAAFLPGWRKHRSLIPAVWGACGLLLLNVAAFGIEGGCCTACSNEQAQTASTLACTDASCTLCQEEAMPSTASGSLELDSVVSSTVDAGTVDSSTATYAGFPTFLITPFGGLLLVVGHVANHRKSCHCKGSKCCLEASDSESNE